MNANQAVRPSLAELLQEPQGVWRGHITSHEDCAAMMRQLTDASNVEVDQDDEVDDVDDFPYTPEAKRDCAGQLGRAMMDFSDYHEGKDAQTHYQVNRLREFSGLEIECFAWQMLAAVENAHNGRLGFPIAPKGQGKAKTWTYRSFGSFGARFAVVKEACRTNKSIVYNITTPRFINKVAADPAKEIKSKLSNKVLNDRRKKPAAQAQPEPQLDNGEGSNTGNQQLQAEENGAGDVAVAKPPPQPKAKRASRPSAKSTRGGRVSKAKTPRAKKMPARGVAALAANFGPAPNINSNPEVPGAQANDQVPHGGPVLQSHRASVFGNDLNGPVPGSQDHLHYSYGAPAPVGNANGQFTGAQQGYLEVNHGASAIPVAAEAGQVGEVGAAAGYLFETLDWDLNPQERDPVYANTVLDLMAKRKK
ncbi:hypothetical protein QBC39DRAFT_386080 [Podospora conica]|nr:hypothetical protein QBC39DRAFT_386080 [Schizothecium conicum]